MTRIRFAFLMPAAIAVAATTISAGGWAVVTLDELPERVEAGRALPLTFMVRQHGVTPLKGLSPRIEAGSGKLNVSADARPTAKVGQYSTMLTLPEPGEWSITIHSGFITSKLTLLPVSVVSAGSQTASAAPALERGRRLFVAKGCVTCHAQEVAMSDPSLNIGPPIVPQKYRDEFLARVLADPSGTLPAARHAAAQMPNLNLQAQEITALVAFINHGSNGSSR